MWIIFERCLFVEGSSGSNGWNQVNVCELGSFISSRITGQIYYSFEIILGWELFIALEFTFNALC